jgi:hypothetical protein
VKKKTTYTIKIEHTSIGSWYWAVLQTNKSGFRATEAGARRQAEDAVRELHTGRSSYEYEVKL